MSSRLPTPITITPSRKPGRAGPRREAATAWAFISPAVLIIIGLSVIPVIWSLLLSFQANDLVTPSRWVGLENYDALVQDPNFGQAVRNTLVYTALYVPLSVVFGLALALVLNQRIRFVGLYRTLMFVPFVVSATAQGVLFSFILDPDFGVANSLLHRLGLSTQGFLTDPAQALFVLVGITLWSGTGFCVVVYLAALQDVRWDLSAGSLPLSKQSESSPEWRTYSAETPGLDVFTTALETARVRPVHPAYPEISESLGKAIVSVLLERSTPEDAIRACAGEADAALRIPR